AMNIPHTTAAATGTPSPSTHWATALSPVSKPHHASAPSRHSSSRKRTSRMRDSKAFTAVPCRLANSVSLDSTMPPGSAASPPMSPRAREIVAAARELLEQEGSVSMRRLADRLGIKAPSLYKHLRDKRALEAALISDAFLEAAERFERAADIYELGAAY